MSIVITDVDGISAARVNAFRLAYSGETPATVLAAIAALMPAAGWAVWDDQAVASEYIVFRAPCVADENGAIAYKYVKLAHVTSKVHLILYESWDSGTHVGTNMAYNSNSVAYGYQNCTPASSGFINFYVTARFLVMATKDVLNLYAQGSSSSYSGPLIVAEYERPAGVGHTVANTSPVPVLWWSVWQSLYDYRNAFSQPRSLNGSTSSVAAISIGLSMIGCAPIGASWGIAAVNYFYLRYVPSGTDYLTGKYNAIAMHIIAGGSVSYPQAYLGRIYGLSLIGKACGAVFGDTVDVKVNSSGIADAAGTLKTLDVVGADGTYPIRFVVDVGV